MSQKYFSNTMKYELILHTFYHEKLSAILWFFKIDEDWELFWDKCHKYMWFFLSILQRGNSSSFQHLETPQFYMPVWYSCRTCEDPIKINSMLPFQAISLPPLRKVSRILLLPTSFMSLAGSRLAPKKTFPAFTVSWIFGSFVLPLNKTF